MRNLKITLAGLAILACAALVAAAPAGASPSADETIVIKRNAAHEPIGWEAKGPTFFGVGSWIDPFRRLSPDWAPVFAGIVKTIETGSAGSFELDFQVLATATHEFGGSCELKSGTGAYAGYRGAGSWTFQDDGVTLSFTCELSVHRNP